MTTMAVQQRRSFLRQFLLQRCASWLTVILLYSAAEEVEAQGIYMTNQSLFYYSPNSNGVTITGYAGPGGAVVIPPVIRNTNVTDIASSTFQNFTGLTSVTIPITITNLGNYTFSRCRNLTNVVLSDVTASIGDYAFNNCWRLQSIELPDCLNSIGVGAFDVCSNLPSITIPNSVSNIKTYTFAVCITLTNVVLSGSITNIGNSAFVSCFGLRSIKLPDSLNNIDDYAFNNCKNLSGVTIPNSVTNIGVYAFGICSSLTNMAIGNGVTTVGNSAFDHCIKLTSVTIGNDITFIGYAAFSSCYSLTAVYFKGNTPSFDINGIFGGDPTTVYYLPETIGWSNSFSGVPAVLWNPTMQTTDGSFGVQNDQFGFNINGTAGIPILVEAGTDLNQPSWTPIFSGTLTNGSIYFSDPQWLNYSNRLYRIRSP